MAKKIGGFEFINITGPAAGPKRQLDMEARPGVDGHALWDTGKRGEPFQALSVVDLLDMASGIGELRQYEAAVGGEPLNFYWAGFSEPDFKVQVLDVKLIQLKQLVNGRGGVRNGSVLLRAEWTLLAVDPHLVKPTT